MEWVTTNFLQQWDSSHRNEAGQQLTARFTPAVVAYGRSLGLPHEIAEDAAQDTMLAFTEALQVGRYDKNKGRMRDWILGIARNKIKTHLKSLSRQQRLGQISPTGFWEGVSDEKAARHTWNTEIRKMQISWCLEQTRRDFKSRPKTYDAFELWFYSDMSLEEVAKELGTSSEAVRVAKHRVLSHMRELMKQLEESI
jgi:RNA polymerase sigma factor (sigma-70 family)